jgi:hypothetical protein
LTDPACTMSPMRCDTALDDDVTFAPIVVAGSVANWLLCSDGRVIPWCRGGDGPDADAAKAAADAKAAEDAAAAKAAEDDTAGGGTGDKPVQVTMTQAELDALIKKQHAKAKGQSEAEFKKWLDQQAMGEADRLKAESADKDKAIDDAKLEVLATKVETAAERAAITAGVKPERLDRFLRLVDLSAIDDLTDDGKPDREAIKTLVEATLADVPEFKGAATNGGANGASGGEFNGAGDKKVWTREEVSKLTPEQFDKHETEIMKQMQGAGIK